MFVLLVCAALAPVLANSDPKAVNMVDRRIAPFETMSHSLGTDIVGRDIMTRLIYGARTTVLISLVALATGAFVGSVLGLIAGYQGGWADVLIMRLADAALGFPTALVAMIIVTLLGAGMENIVLAVVITVWARFARMIRGDMLGLRDLDFVTSAKIAGVSTPVIIARHIFPNTVNTLMVITSLQVGQVILLETSLSFLGFGLPPGAAQHGVLWFLKAEQLSWKYGGCRCCLAWLSLLWFWPSISLAIGCGTPWTPSCADNNPSCSLPNQGATADWLPLSGLVSRRPVASPIAR